MSNRIWRIAEYASYESAYWDQQLVLFNQASGETHLLNRPVDWILSQIASAPCSMEQLVGIAERDGIINKNKDNGALFSSMLSSLEEIGLIESGVESFE